MKTKTLSLAVLSLASMLTVSCSNSNPNVKKESLSQVQVNSLVSAGKTNEAAALLSTMAERILLNSPENILAADELFNKALELNKNDPKANLYSSFTSLTKVTKGFAKRFNSLLTPEQKAELKRIENDMNNKGLYDLVDFANNIQDSKKNVSNYKDAKKFLKSELLQEIKNSSVRISLINDQKFQLIVPNKSSVEACAYSEEAGWNCETEKAKSVKQIAFDQYDAKAIKSIFKSYETELTIALMFNTDDLQLAAKEIQSHEKSTDQEVVAIIKKYPNLLKIESKDDLRTVFQNTESVLNEFIDFASMRDSLCNEEVRSNHLSGPICIDDEQLENMKQGITLIAGPSEILIGKDQNGNDVEILVNLRAWEESSFKGLQSLLPNSFDENGKAKSIKDKTFGGLFPNGDFLEKMENVKKSSAESINEEI